MHIIYSIAQTKRSWHSCPRRMNAGNKNTTSTHHPRRQNVNTIMVGLKTHKKISQKVVNPRDKAGNAEKEEATSWIITHHPPGRVSKLNRANLHLNNAYPSIFGVRHSSQPEYYCRCTLVLLHSAVRSAVIGQLTPESDKRKAVIGWLMLSAADWDAGGDRAAWEVHCLLAPWVDPCGNKSSPPSSSHIDINTVFTMINMIIMNLQHMVVCMLLKKTASCFRHLCYHNH